MEGKSAVKVGEYRSYIFDLDGTLFSIPVDWAGVRREISALVGEDFSDTPLFLKLQQLAASKPGMRERLLSVIDSYELRAVGSAKAMPGASELLYSLFEVARIALVTLQGKKACGEILQKHKLDDLFEAVVTREDSMDRSEQLLIALNRLGAEARATLFTGDRLNDVVCARKVGLDVALVGRDAVKDPKPNYNFASLVELRAYLA
ncbi:MAG: HAD hydrolase-like protein [Nitrososphaerales archaeon]|nr:HAD hydrolase-like protein [Nitrososphaerales archaeon]